MKEKRFLWFGRVIKRCGGVSESSHKDECRRKVGKRKPEGKMDRWKIIVRIAKVN